MKADKIKLYKNNNINDPREYTIAELIYNFIRSGKPYESLLYGVTFENAFPLSLPGSADIDLWSDSVWKKLWKEFKHQDPNPDYKI